MCTSATGMRSERIGCNPKAAKMLESTMAMLKCGISRSFFAAKVAKKTKN